MRYQKILEFIQGGAVFLPRQSLHDPDLEKALDLNSPVRLDFEEMRRHEQAMLVPWIKVLEQEGFVLPEQWTPKLPADLTSDEE